MADSRSTHPAFPPLPPQEASSEAYAAYLLYSIAEQSSDLIAALDADLRYLTFNRAYHREFARLFDAEVEVGASFGERLGHRPEVRAEMLEAWRRALDGEVFTLLVPLGSTGHTRGLYEITFRPLKDPAGALIGAFHVARDVSARERARAQVERLNEQLERRVEERTAELRRVNHDLIALNVRADTARQRAEEALALLDTLLEGAPVGIGFVDPDLRFVRVNARLAEITGVPQREHIGGSVPDVLPRIAAEQLADLRRVLATGEPVAREITGTTRAHRAEPRTWWMAFYPVRRPGGQIIGVGAVVEDITERKRSEEALRAAKEAAEGANRAKSDFMAVISHELRTPLTAIIGYAELLEMDVPEPIGEHARDHVRRIRLSAQHQQQIIEEILTFSRLEAGRQSVEIETVDLSELLQEVRAIIEPLARQKGLTFDVQLSAMPDTLRTDPRKLRQVLLNLLGNAVKFTEQGAIELRLHHEAGELEMHVADTGIGIAPVDQIRLFEPFWQADGSYTRVSGGTGLGLAITRRFVDMLDGEIRVESAPGRGSTFSVRLPV